MFYEGPNQLKYYLNRGHFIMAHNQGNYSEPSNFYGRMIWQQANEPA